MLKIVIPFMESTKLMEGGTMWSLHTHLGAMPMDFTSAHTSSSHANGLHIVDAKVSSYMAKRKSFTPTLFLGIEKDVPSLIFFEEHYSLYIE